MHVRCFESGQAGGTGPPIPGLCIIGKVPVHVALIGGVNLKENPFS